MKYVDWDPDKNALLKEERGISFEDILTAVDDGRTLDLYQHKNKKRYARQWVLVVEIEEYAYVVPFVVDDEKFFLKTIIPNREATAKYIIGRKKKK